MADKADEYTVHSEGPVDALANIVVDTFQVTQGTITAYNPSQPPPEHPDDVPEEDHIEVIHIGVTYQDGGESEFILSTDAATILIADLIKSLT